MKCQVAVSLVLSLGTIAHADVSRATYRMDPARIGATWVAPTAAGVSHIIYMNNCQPGGCTIHPGNDNATTDTSSIPQSTASISAYQGTSAQWQQLVTCVQQTYAPFNVQIVTTRPAAGTNFHEAIVAGHSADIGEGGGVLGVSPFSCGYIPNSVSFTFANEEPTNIYDLCWTVAQETSHSWGLDHKYDNRDPMTYLGSGPSWKQFQNQPGSCGEYGARQCNCDYAITGSAQENSYALIMATFGSSAPDTVPPMVKITTPTNGGSVMAGFSVSANITDDIAVEKATLTIDGTMVGTALMGAPWSWAAPSTLGQGSHHIVVTGYDLGNNMTSDAVDVTIGSSCTSSGCTDATQVCVDGHCVAGPGNPGGLGTVCTTSASCASMQCADDGAGHKYCTDPCDPTKNECPSGFGCVATGASSGVCWPGADSGGGGGCSTHGDGGAILLGLGFAAVLITRRRR